MDIDTQTAGGIHGITALRVVESATDIGTAEMEFAGFGPEWLQYMEPVTVRHRGRVIFHGKITGLERSNDGGSITSRCTVSNFLWLLNRQTLGQQLAQIMASDDQVTIWQIGRHTGASGRSVTWGGAGHGNKLGRLDAIRQFRCGCGRDTDGAGVRLCIRTYRVVCHKKAHHHMVGPVPAA